MKSPDTNNLPIFDAEVVTDVIMGNSLPLTEEVISNEPYDCPAGRLAEHPVLQFGIGKTYISKGYLTRIFQVVSPGYKIFYEGLGDSEYYQYVRYVVNFTDIGYTGMVEVDQRTGYTCELQNFDPADVALPHPKPTSFDHGNISIGPCEGYTPLRKTK